MAFNNLDRVCQGRHSSSPVARLQVEALEDRLVPFVANPTVTGTVQLVPTTIIQTPVAHLPAIVAPSTPNPPSPATSTRMPQPSTGSVLAPSPVEGTNRPSDVRGEPLTARLESGILTVIGSDDADRIAVYQVGRTITVQEMVRGLTLATIDAGNVRQIIVDARGGNDWINLGVSEPVPVASENTKARLPGNLSSGAVFAVASSSSLPGSGSFGLPFPGGGGGTIYLDPLGKHGTPNPFANRRVTLSVPSVVYGGNGNDTLIGGSGRDTLWGGGGSDELLGGAGNDFVYGESGGDLIVGGLGNDNLDGGTGDDHVLGGKGDDVLSGGDGEDHFFGEAGSDRIFTGPGQNWVEGGEGDDQLYGGQSADTILGSAGNDLIDAGGGDDQILAGNGRDTVYAGAGHDIADGEAGDDILHGQAGNDMLAGGAGHDRVFGNDGVDWLDGGVGNDTLLGGTGMDWLGGGAGNDRLEGGADKDGMDGGAGVNTLIQGDSTNSTAPQIGSISQASIFGDIWDGVVDVGEWIGGAVTVVAEWTWDRAVLISKRYIDWHEQLGNRVARFWNGVWDGVSNWPWEKDFWSGWGRAIVGGLEVAGLSEAWETVFDLLKPWQRAMTEAEKALARSVFGDSIDYSRVRIDTASIMAAIGRTHVTGYVINSAGGMTDDVLLHELTHIWQFENDGLIYIPEAVGAQSIGGYEYPPGTQPGDLSQATFARRVADLQRNLTEDLNGNNDGNRGLAAYNREAQGEIVRHYYIIRDALRNPKPNAGPNSVFALDPVTLQSYLDVYARFVKDVSTLSLADLQRV